MKPAAKVDAIRRTTDGGYWVLDAVRRVMLGEITETSLGTMQVWRLPSGGVGLSRTAAKAIGRLAEIEACGS